MSVEAMFAERVAEGQMRCVRRQSRLGRMRLKSGRRVAMKEDRCWSVEDVSLDDNAGKKARACDMIQ